VLTTYTIAAKIKRSSLSIHSRLHHRNIVARQQRGIKSFLVRFASTGKRFDLYGDGWFNITRRQFLEMS
jgi:hypothetical protein